MKVSVVTVSKRTGWEEPAIASIENQTFQDFNWIVVGEEYIDLGDRADFHHAPLQIRPSNLNRSLNAALKHCLDSDYVIFYQDFIRLKPDCFEKLLELAKPNTFVTTCTTNYDGSDDGRYTHVDAPRSCLPAEWEANVALAPMPVIRELGGFDEEYDNGWSWDNCNLAERAAMLGCKFILDESNRPQLIPHELFSKLQLELNGERHEATMKAIRSGKKPLRLNYL